METLNYLWVDLNRKEVKPYPIEDKLFKLYLGGKGMAARILLEEMKPTTDPFAPESLLIVNTGPLVGSGAPCSSRFNISGKNVLTGGIASSNCGGSFGIKLRQSGWDGLIIYGQASRPVYMVIDDGNISFFDADKLWGLDTEKTQDKLPEGFGKLVIGPAGENLVFYAGIVSQERIAGRCGLGAVMGAKKLKAVIARGQRKIRPQEPEKFRKTQKEWVKQLQTNPITGEALPSFGTMGFVNKASVLGLLPVKNFSQENYPQAEKLSGEYYAENYLKRNYGCHTCPIKCGRRQEINGSEHKGPEYETVGLLGSNILNSDLERISRWNLLADRMGMDTISLGGTLGFVMELKEKGLADFGISFDNYDQVETLIKEIAYQKNRGKELSRGSQWLAEKYGATDFVPTGKRMEFAAYDPASAQGMGLGYATSNRGACHLNGGYMVFLEGIGPLQLNPKAMKVKPALTVIMQNLLEAISTGGSCLFTSLSALPSFLYKTPPTSRRMALMSNLTSYSGPLLSLIQNNPRLLNINSNLLPHTLAIRYLTGEKMTIGKFLEIGERSYNTGRIFNLKAGLQAKDDNLSPRIIQRGVPLDNLLSSYYKQRGWDENGRPQTKKLKKLGIEECL